MSRGYESPVCDSDACGLASEFPSVFSACVVTRAQARKFGKTVDLSDLFLQPRIALKVRLLVWGNCPMLSRCPLVVVLKQNKTIVVVSG